MARTQFSEANAQKINDLVCFSHLRWDFVYQRPQHLMSRFAKKSRVFFIEEPLYHDHPDSFEISLSDENVHVVRPYLQHNASSGMPEVARQKRLINLLFKTKKIKNFIAWYYTPMALKISCHLNPEMIVYDCMDELSAFKFAPAELKIMEAELFKKSQVVFTGGHSLYRAKKHAHINIHPFPSSIDKAHFSAARQPLLQPEDQVNIPHVRLGFYGVIDERFDIKLIEEVAARRPEWHIILVGPVVKIDPADLPKRDNIHYLGGKNYKQLPAYLSGWDISIIPFEKNESTRFISPTKTPEYLAAGKPVISTSIADIVTPYADQNLVYIADNADEFIAAAENELRKSPRQYKSWLKRVDAFLENNSWNNTAAEMHEKMLECLVARDSVLQEKQLKSVA